MAATAAQIKASEKYDRENTRQIVLKLNRNSDADILMKLDEAENRQGYIKQLIRDDLHGGGDVLTLNAIRLLIQPVAKKYKFHKVYLYGSYARGEATAESDVDLMVEGGKFESIQDYFQAVDVFQKVLGKKTELTEYEAVMMDHSRAGRSFRNHFDNDKVLIYG